MAGKRKRPKLRYDGRYFVVNIYKPDGKRTMISFGPLGERSEGEIRIAFETWIDLYNKYPHKVLFYKDPYEAIEKIVNPVTGSTIQDLLSNYEKYLKKTLQPTKQGRDHPDITFFNRVCNFLKPYYDWSVDSLGPDELIDVRNSLIDYKYIQGKTSKKYLRRGINDTINWIPRIWAWGVGRTLVKESTLKGFNEVKPLRMGDQRVHDKVKRKRVTEEDFQKVIRSVNSVVSDMLKLLWHTGMRPYEVCEMRPYDILLDDPDCWLYIPGRDITPVGQHKTTRYEQIKVIPLAGESQEILSSRIEKYDSEEYIFNPQDALKEIIRVKSENRKTPLSYGNKPGSNRKKNPMIQPRDHYDSNSLRKACQRGCIRAGIQIFSPYDLRRTAATNVRAKFGKQDARTLLGHTKISTTEIYLLEEVQEAIKIAKKLNLKK